MKEYSQDFNQLLEEGWTSRFAKVYLDTIEKENNNPCFDKEYANWAHEHGFYAESACAYELNEQNIHLYLPDYEYMKIWPLNSWTRIWVNDKLTLKYMLAHTEYNDFLPKYYYYSTPKGLLPLIDNPIQDDSMDSFIGLLKTTGEFACKPCNGTTAIGFIHLKYKNEIFFANNQQLSESELKEMIMSHPNYVFTEYIRPNSDFAKFSPLIHTLRIVTVNDKGINPRIIGGYLRLPNKSNGNANFTVLDGSEAAKFNLWANVNMSTGEYGDAKKTFANKIEHKVINHPDSGAVISGKIDKFKELKKIILGIAQRFNSVEYMGFDIGVTDKGFKCMEINTHPGIKYMQIFRPLLQQDTKDYFVSKIAEIDSLSKNEKIIRNKIPR